MNEIKDNIPKGIAFMIISAFGFAFMGVMVKLSGDIPVFEKVFFRNLVSLFIALFIVRTLKGNGSLFGENENRKYLLIRSLFGLSAVVLYFYAIENLVLSDAYALNRISPFFVLIFAGLFLREKITRVHMVSIVAVFAGALLIVKPELNYSVLPAISGLASAILAGAAYTMVRLLKDKESPATIVFHFSLVSVLGMIPFVLLDYRIPNLEQLVYLLLTGVGAGIGQFGLTLGYKYAPASHVSLYSYTGIVFAGILGYVFWGELSDFLGMLGSLLIIVTATILFFHNRSNQSISTENF